MFSFLRDMGNYDLRKVDRTDIGRFTVSTAYTSDEGYETAILDANGVHPVENYETKEEAMEGHLRWCIAIGEGMRAVVKTGGPKSWGLPDEIITLEEKED